MAKDKKCVDLVQEKYQGRLKQFETAKNFLNLEKSERDKFNEFLSDKYQDLNQYEDFFDYVNQSGLSFDFVEDNTFEDQKHCYWRFQLSWGGPSDEFRIYTDYDKNINYIEYWFMDWFDGASIRVDDDVINHLCQMFLECSEHPEPYQYEDQEVARQTK